ncbi:MAG: carboxypeptidase regulatory-like domain-containing protein [Acidobacteria bacterium]|nr:carboxypeptidase regulatory-like domain-containing protein [Acidobacteriota bacterium]
MTYSARLLTTLALSAATLTAQQITGSVAGTITDKSGSAIAGAAVKLTSTTTSAARDTATADNGNFLFNGILSGSYNLTVTHSGFKKHQTSNIALNPNENLTVPIIKLDVGDVAESVTVTADGATIQIASGERSGVITAEEIENLTVMNRDFAALVALLPGVVDNPGAAEVQGFSNGSSYNVSGNRSNGNSITIDGGSTENTNGGGGNNFVSMDAVQAVRIVTSVYQAEFGRKPGASIMAVTKSGSQKYHGAAYWYYRHEWMNANNFFNNRQGVRPTPRRVQTPGFNIGGPISIGRFNRGKSKLFFFTSQEFIREKRPQSIRNLTMPTALERTGDFSATVGSNGALTRVNDPLNSKLQFPGNIIPANRINTSGQNYLKLLPLPNGVNAAIARNQYNYQVQESLNIPKWTNTTRVDYVIDPKTTLWIKYNYWREDQQGWAVSAGNANWGWMPAHYLSQTHAPVVAMTRILSPSTILELSARLVRWTENGAPLNDSDLQRLNRKTAGVNIPQLYPAGNPWNLVPNATFGGVTSAPNTSFNARFPLRGAESPVFSDAILTRTRGQHVMKAGFYWERWRAVKGESGNWAGTVDFSTDGTNPGDANQPFANALLGNFKTYSESNNRPPLYEGTTSYEWFAQDNFKIARGLTIEFGVRFGWSTPFYSLRRQEAGFVPSRWDPAKAIRLMIPVRVNNTRFVQDPTTGTRYPITLIGAIAPGTGDPYNGTVNLLTDLNYPRGLRNNSGVKAAPRFGFAWDPFKTGKTAIRGGGGVFYEIHEKDLWGYALHLDPPNQLTPQIWYGNLDTFSNTQGFLFPSNTSGLSSARTLGRSMQLSFGIQRHLGWGTVLDTSYVATFGRHLLASKNLNAVPAGTTLQPSAIDPSNPPNPIDVRYLRPYIGYGNINYYNYDANSSYHSLQTTVNHRFRRGLQGGVAWTWSKAMDYSDSDTAQLSALVDRRIWNYGKAGFDRTHILKAHWIYAVPKIAKRLPDMHSFNFAKKAVFDGWQISGISTQMSGAPAGVTLSFLTGNTNTWSGSPTDAPRPIVIANPILPKSERSFERHFNVNAFGVPAQGTMGNAPKDVFRGPGINNFDISLFKDFRAFEKVRAQFRFEAYNVFNHTQFSGVDANVRLDNRTGALATQTVGQYTASRLPRRMQLAIRFTF